MNPEFVFVGETATRDEVLQWMRLQDLNVDQLDTIVLLDADVAEVFHDSEAVNQALRTLITLAKNQLPQSR